MNNWSAALPCAFITLSIDDLRLLSSSHFDIRFKDSLCQERLKDVLRRGVAFAASAVNRQHYTGCVDEGTII